MEIISTSVHLIDYENGTTTVIEPPEAFEAYVSELISNINSNTTIREFTTTSNRTEVIACVLDTQGNAEDTELVQKNALIIANRLLLKEKAAQERIEQLAIQVQKGSLIQALIRDEASGADTYLLAKVEHTGFVDDADFTFKSGFSKDRKSIWKTCIFDLSDPEADVVLAKIYSNTAAKYWWSDFLELHPVTDDTLNTKNAFDAVDSTINRMIKREAQYDLTVIRNAFVSYFRTADQLDYDEMVHSVLDNYTSVSLPQERRDALRDRLLALPDERKFDRLFTPVASAVKAKIKKEYPVYQGIKLQITEGIEGIGNVISAERDTDGTHYLKIKTTDDNTYKSFCKSQS